LMRLVHTGRIPLATLIARLTCDPARVFGLDAGSLRPGAAADLVLLDPLAEWTVDAARFRSKGKNTPLDGERLHGRVVLTMVNGTVAHQLEAQVHGYRAARPGGRLGLAGRTVRGGRPGGGRGRLQHEHDWLPGDRHRSLLRRADGRAHPPAGRQLRRLARGIGVRAPLDSRLHHSRAERDVPPLGSPGI